MVFARFVIIGLAITDYTRKLVIQCGEGVVAVGAGVAISVVANNVVSGLATALGIYALGYVSAVVRKIAADVVDGGLLHHIF